MPNAKPLTESKNGRLRPFAGPMDDFSAFMDCHHGSNGQPILVTLLTKNVPLLICRRRLGQKVEIMKNTVPSKKAVAPSIKSFGPLNLVPNELFPEMACADWNSSSASSRHSRIDPMAVAATNAGCILARTFR